MWGRALRAAENPCFPFEQERMHVEQARMRVGLLRGFRSVLERVALVTCGSAGFVPIRIVAKGLNNSGIRNSEGAACPP